MRHVALHLRPRILILSLLACLWTGESWAQGLEPAPWPTSQPEWSASSFVRLSLRVNSIEESLKLYRDILGFEVFYAPKPSPLGYFGDWLGYDPDQQVKYVVVRSPMKGHIETSLGHIGLAEVGGSSDSSDNRSRNGIGEVWIMISVDNTVEIYEQVKEAGYEVNLIPKENPDGSRTSLLMTGPDDEKLYISEELVRSLLVQAKN